MKTTRVRSMRDIPTVQGLRDRAIPDSREQIMSELAHLEHEKARLEREINIWIANQKKTQERIRLVQERVEMLNRTMEELSPAVPRRRSAQHGAAPDEEDEKKESRFHAVSLEY